MSKTERMDLFSKPPPPKPGRIVATYCVFNTQALIYDSLTSVARAVDEIRLYDGRFSDYRCPCLKDHDNSCDNTAKEIEAFQADYPNAPPVRYIPLQAMPEMEKRTRMFHDIPEGDVAFVIDDDELLFGRSEPLREFADAKPARFAYIDFLFALNGHGSGTPIPLARLFVSSPGLCYDTYYRIMDGKDVLVDMIFDNHRLSIDGRRMPNRCYIHPSTRICELWSGYRGKTRDKARDDYNSGIAKRGWK